MAGEVTFQLTEGDLIAVHRDWLRDRIAATGDARDLQRYSLIFLLFVFLAWVISQAFSEMSIAATGVAALLPYVLAGLSTFWLCWGHTHLSVPRAARRLFRQRATFQRPLSYGWSEAGLSFRTAHGSGLIPWGNLFRWTPAERNFLFFTDEQMFYFIPRSALSEVQAQDIEATVADNCVPLRPPA